MLASIQWSNGVEDAWSDVASFIPKLFGFLAVLLIGYLIVKAISKIADAALERVGFDDAVERGGIKKALAKSELDASSIVSKLIFYVLFLFVLQMAFGVFGTNPISDMITGVVAYLPKVFAAIVIVVVMAAIAAAAKAMLTNMLGGLSYGSTLANVTAGSIVAVAAFMALSQLQIAPAIVNGLFYGLLALVVGSGIIAIGFGGVQPMQQRWQRTLDRIDEEAPRARQQMQRVRAERSGGETSAMPTISGRGRVVTTDGIRQATR